MRLVFRFDDFSAATAVTGGTTYEVFNAFLRARVPLLVGVIPDAVEDCHDPGDTRFHRLDENQAGLALLREGLAQGWQLAMHGCTHQRTPEMDYTEFIGQRLTAQRAKIQSGLEIMRACFPGRAIEIFAPPWNSCDALTVQCLEECGFRVLCTGMSAVASGDFGLQIVKFTVGLKEFIKYARHFSLAELSRALGESLLVVELHEYDFYESGRGAPIPLSALGDLFHRLQADGISACVVPVGERIPPLNPRHLDLLRARFRLIAIEEPRWAQRLIVLAHGVGLGRCATAVKHSHLFALLAWRIGRMVNRPKALLSGRANHSDASR